MTYCSREDLLSSNHVINQHYECHKKDSGEKEVSDGDRKTEETLQSVEEFETSDDIMDTYN